MTLLTCEEYAKQRGVAVPTVSLHARKLGFKKIAGRWIFTPDQIAQLEASIVGKRGRPFKNENRT